MSINETGEIALMLLAAFLVGLFAGRLSSQSTIKFLRRRLHALRRGEELPKKAETAKKVVWACLINGFAWVWCSYVLAALDKVQIAESLSQVAVTEIIGVVLAYCAKAAIENLSKNNRWPDKSGPAQELDQEEPLLDTEP